MGFILRIDALSNGSHLADMSTTTREFTRKFAHYRRDALGGASVEVRDREGNSFVFAVKKPAPKTLAEAIGHMAGIVDSGRPKKSLKGYGRS